MGRAKFRYFEEEDILHLSISDEHEHNSIEIKNNIFVEINKYHEIIGLEIIDASSFLMDYLVDYIKDDLLQMYKKISLEQSGQSINTLDPEMCDNGLNPERKPVDYYRDGNHHYLILAWGSGCAEWREVRAEDAARAEAFPLETMAHLLESRVDEVAKFAKDDGTIQCAGTNRAGRRCGNYVGRIQRPFAEWLTMERAGTTRCHLHRKDSAQPRA